MSKRRSLEMNVDQDEHLVKRRKRMTADTPEKESPKQPTVQELGQSLLNEISAATDRKGHSIAEVFTTLPNRREYADYYKVIKRPLALDTIQKKLKSYKSTEDLAADFDLLVANAQLYNKASSAVYANSVKIRNLVHKLLDENVREETATPERRPTRARRASSTVVASIDFDLKQILMTLIKDMTEVKDANGYSAADHFLELPSKRQFPDYYETIEHPTTITIIRKKLKKGEYIGASAFQDFEEEVRRLFSNAETYNEKGSDIVDDAERLKAFFNNRINEIRKSINLPLSKADTKKEVPSTKSVVVEEPALLQDNGQTTPISQTSPKLSNTKRVEPVAEVQGKVDTGTDVEMVSPPELTQISPPPDQSADERTVSTQSAPKIVVESEPLFVSEDNKTNVNQTTANVTPLKAESPIPRQTRSLSAGSPQPLLSRPSPSTLAVKPVMSPPPLPVHGSVNAASTPVVSRVSPSSDSQTKKPEETTNATSVAQEDVQPNPLRRPAHKSHLDSPITRLHVYSSDKIQPAEKFDVSLLPNKDSILSSNVFHLGHDNNILILRPYLHDKLSNSDTRYNLLVTVNGAKVFPIHNQHHRNAPKDSVSDLFELHLARGMTSKIECTCDSGTALPNGQQDLNRATFLLFTYVAPKDF